MITGEATGKAVTGEPELDRSGSSHSRMGQ